MAALWTANEAALATGGVTSADWSADGVVIDSRAVVPGDLFVALKGERSDGHDHVAAAFAKGASAALVSRAVPGVGPCLMVADTEAGLRALAVAARARSTGRIIALTGSVGKTGTKDALAFLLGTQGKTVATEANYNNQLGVPLCVARLPADAAFGVFELGMNHPGEISPIARLARPHVAIITTVTAAHLENFSSEEAIADEKGAIFEGLEPGGVAILPRDNRHFDRLATLARRRAERVVSFGQDDRALARLDRVEVEADGSLVWATIEGRRLEYRVGAAGLHWAMNSLAILAAISVVGGDIERAAEDMAALRPSPGRGNRITLPVGAGEITVIDDAYNGQPAAMAASLAVLATTPATGRRIAVLGEMAELGPTSGELHAELGRTLPSAIDLVLTVGPMMERLRDQLSGARLGAHAHDATALVRPLIDLLAPGDVVLVKGSKASRVSTLVTALVEHACAAPPHVDGVR